jgi:hypothetical protein
MAKTMNEGLTGTLGNDAKPSGASFLEVLAGTSALSSLPLLGSLPQTPAIVGQKDSETPGQGEQANPQTTASADDQQLVHNRLPQTLFAAALTAQKPATSQFVASSSQGHSVTAGTNHAGGHQDNSQPADTSLPVQINTPIQPAPPLALSTAQPVPPDPAAGTSDTQPANTGSAASLSTMQPTQFTAATGVSNAQPANTTPAVHVFSAPLVDTFLTAPASDTQSTKTSDAHPTATASSPMPAIPSPVSSIADAVNTEATRQEQADAITGASTKAVSTQAAPAGRTDSQGQNKAEAPAAKNNGGTSGTDAKSAQQTAQATPSQPASAPAAGSAALGMVVLPDNVLLPSLNLMPGSGDVSTLAGTTAQGAKTSDASAAKVTDTSNATDAKKSSDASTTATSSNAASNDAASNGPAVQRTQADGSQPAPVAAKTTDTGTAQAAAQIQSFATHGGTHDIPASQSRADGASDTVRSGDQPGAAETLENTATPGINTANVIQKMSETEMRIGVHSADFGDVSIRTLVSQQQMTAQISVDHSDLGKAISAHIPAMEAKIGGDSGLRALVEVNQSGMSFSGERGFSSQRDQRSFTKPAQNQDTATSTETDSPVMRAAIAPNSSYRLDIRA